MNRNEPNPPFAVIHISKPHNPSTDLSLLKSMAAQPARASRYGDTSNQVDKEGRLHNTVFTSWLFLGLGKCILPTTFVLLDCFSASMPPRRQHQTVISHDQTQLLASNKVNFSLILCSRKAFSFHVICDTLKKELGRY
jgi:hypothetical protein